MLESLVALAARSVDSSLMAAALSAARTEDLSALAVREAAAAALLPAPALAGNWPGETALSKLVTAEWVMMTVTKRMKANMRVGSDMMRRVRRVGKPRNDDRIRERQTPANTTPVEAMSTAAVRLESVCTVCLSSPKSVNFGFYIIFLHCAV